MKGAVAAGHKETANAAVEVLRDGGNAFDAAVAGFFAACVCEPVLSALGGGGFLLASDLSGRAKVFDFFTHTPREKAPESTLDFYPVTVDFGSAQQEFHIGLGASATPGAVHGMFQIHRDLGTMPMRDLVQPALELARGGVVVEAFQEYLLQLVAPIYMTESALPLFSSPADPKRLVGSGEVFKNPQLADVMELLAVEGKDLFYRGEIARELIGLCEGKGHLRYQDLVEYETKIREPLSVDYKRHRYITNPPPSAGGILIAFGLGLLKHIDLKSLGFGGYRHVRALVEVLLRTSEARMGNFDYGPHIGLLDDELLAVYRREMAATAAAYKGTTHISVIDGKKNIAAMTVSNGEGCGELIPGTGIMLNNMLGEEDLNPSGFHGWNNNVRMSSMMAPSLLLARDGTVVALGSGGSNRIRTAILQVVSNIVDFGFDPKTAITQPRVHMESDVLNIESGLPGGTIGELCREFPDHRVFERANMFFGGVHAVAASASGGVICIGDPRRSGAGVKE